MVFQLDQLRSQHNQAQLQLDFVVQEVRDKYKRASDTDEKVLFELKAGQTSTDTKLEENKTKIANTEEILNNINSGLFIGKHKERIHAAEAEIRHQYDDEIDNLRKTLEALPEKINSTDTQIQKYHEGLSKTKSNLSLLGSKKVPKYFSEELQKAVVVAEKEFLKQISEFRSALMLNMKERIQLDRGLSRMESKIKSLQQDVRELSRLNKGDIVNIFSGAWWRTSNSDPDILIKTLSSKVNWTREQIQEKNGISQSLQSQINDRINKEESWISEARSNAIQVEFDRQQELLATLKLQLDLEEEQHQSLKQQNITLQASLDQAVHTCNANVADARQEEEHNVTVEVKEEIKKLAQDSKMLANAIKTCNVEISEVNSRLGMLANDEKRELEEQTQIKRNVVDGIQQEIDQSTLNITNLTSRNQLDVKPHYTTEIFEQLKKDINDVRTTYSLYEEIHKIDNIETSVGGQIQGENQEIVSGSLYLDFKKNADEDIVIKNRTYHSLRRKLGSLRNKHGQSFFPGVDEETLLESFIENFYPGKIPQLFLLANLSLDGKNITLAIRPQVIGPRLESMLPQGLSLTIKGILFDNRIDEDNPVFLVQDIVDTSQSIERDFEQPISILSHVNEQAYPRSIRKDNILSEAIVSNLPEISRNTRTRLKDWTDYLNWKQSLIEKGIQGIRYTEVGITEDKLIRFLVISQSREHFQKVRRILRGDDLRAYPISYSKDEWNFSFNEEYSAYKSGYGDIVGELKSPEKELSREELSSLDSPWEAALYQYIFFRPSIESDDTDIEHNSKEQLTQECKRIISKIPPTGFLASSSQGDRVLIERQRKQLKQLEMQSGYSPFLSSYLFDIGKANVPSHIIEIGNSEWALPSLNDDQRYAVRKMISTPDIGLVQGPPGTGKTTMIAEAIYQFAIRNKSVLVVSQANLAVDNVLERLPSVPEIRAIRLGRRTKSENPFSSDKCIYNYYRSISNSCKSALKERHRNDEVIKELSQTLSNVDFLKNDIEDSLKDKKCLDSKILKVRGNIAQEKAKTSNIQSVAQMEEDALTFKELFIGRSQWSGALSESVLTVFYKTIVVLLDSLVDVGIKLNTKWACGDTVSGFTHSNITADLINQWHKLLNTIPRIEEDVEHLTATVNSSDSGTFSSGHLTDLKMRLENVESQMKQDASLILEWQQLSAQVEQAKQGNQGIDIDFYKSIFNVKDEEWLLDGNDTNGDKTLNSNIATHLSQSVIAIKAVRAQIIDGFKSVSDAIDTDIRENMRPTNDSASKIAAMSSNLGELSVKTGEIQAQIEDKVGRIATLFKPYIELTGTLKNFSLENYDATKNILQGEVDRLDIDAVARQNYRKLWEPVIKDWVKDLNNESTLKNDSLHLSDKYVENANVVGVSCNERPGTLEDAGHRKFDVVIIDEVSKANPTEIIMPLLLGRTAILVGDHRQLPPLFSENSNSYEELLADAEEESLDRDEGENGSEITEANFDRFEKMVTSSLFKEHFEKAPDELKSFLFTQYRMHPQIMGVINQFYEKRLNCGLKDPDGRDPSTDKSGLRLHGLTLKNQLGGEYINPDLHVCWIDSTIDPKGKKHFETKFGAGNSKANNLEAALTARVLRDLDEQCSLQGYGKKGMTAKKVGVVTFYNGQARNLKEAIKSEQRKNGAFKSVDVDVNTVDRYQGQERPIIIVSMVRNPRWKLSARANTAQFERINVALSRAQELLIVTGAQEVFSKYPVQLPNLEGPGKRKVEVYRYIIEEIKRQGGFWMSGEIISQEQFKLLYPGKARSERSKASKKTGRPKFSKKPAGSAKRKG